MYINIYIKLYYILFKCYLTFSIIFYSGSLKYLF